MWKADSPWHIPSAVAILCAALCVRVLLPLIAYTWTRDARIFNTPDTASYRACAESLARTGSFSIGGIPEIVRTPGYPVLLVPGVAFGHVTAVTVWLQIVLGCVTVLLVYRVAFILTGSRPSAAASGLLCAFEPLSVLYCSLLLAETLFATTLMLFLFLLLVYLKRGTMRHLAAAACALALSVYVRPIAYWMPLVMTLLLAAAACGRRGRRGRDALRALAFLCICAALIGVWQVRNYLDTGYGGFSAIGDINLYFYHGAGVRASITGEPYYVMQRRMGYGDEMVYLQQHPDQKGLSLAQRYILIGKEGREIIRAHPLIFAKSYSTGLLQTVFGPGATEYLKLFNRYREGSGLLGEFIDRGYAPTLCMLARKKPLVFWSSLILGAALFVYFAFAILSLWTRGVPRTMLAAVVVPAFYLLLMSGGLNGYSRFRHPVMPLVCVLAGCGLERVGRRGDRRTGHAGGIHHGAHDDARTPGSGRV